MEYVACLPLAYKADHTLSNEFVIEAD